MIPRRLRLRNFLSYRDGTVDFSSLHVATLAGRNGDGKSALLDAITWALWGEARGRLEDDRIYLGEQDMRVELDFEVEGDVFRAVRKRTRGRSAGAVDLFQLDANGEPRALSGGTARETQAEINRRLRMDYLTFVNSVFLAQGRANEFTTRTPADRKKVLRKILGLERYEELAEHAHERRRVAEANSVAEERQIEEALGELAGAAGVEQELQAVSAERAQVGCRIAEHEEEADGLRLAAAEHARREQAVADHEERSSALKLEIATRGAALTKLEAGLATVQETISRAETIEGDYEKLCVARQEERGLALLSAEARDLEGTIAQAERELAKERVRLETQIGHLEERRVGAATLLAGLAALRVERETLDRDRTRLASFDDQLQAARGADAEAQQQRATSAAEASAHRDQAQALKKREALLEGAALCPVCGKPLRPAELATTLEEYRRERRELGERYRSARESAVAAEGAAAAHQANVTAVLTQRTTLDESQRVAERELETRLTGALAAERELPDLDQTLTDTRVIIASEAFAPEARTCLVAARDRLAGLGYDTSEHARLRERLAELEGAESAYRELARAQEQAHGLDERIVQEGAELRLREESHGAAAAALVEARSALEASEDVSGRFGAVEEELARCRERAKELDLRRGRLEERRRHLDQLAARIEGAKDKLASDRDSAQLHADLAQAFGKNGVQAMLIEQSLPEVEQIANAMLEKMTDGRIQLTLATQRETRSGKSKVETLDIRISDELGTRDYEMYSGGEAFRVDFALRIALSRLLAARSGAALPTLIIDEGFGTQDSEGVDRLVEAITSISDEFRLILLVTHIDELRERFERRIEVTKDPERGSLVRVV